MGNGTRTVWIESLHRLVCPACDRPLIEQAGRHDVLERPDPVYVVGDVRECPIGHDLPALDELYAYRDSKGIPATVADPVVEVRRPQ